MMMEIKKVMMMVIKMYITISDEKESPWASSSPGTC